MKLDEINRAYIGSSLANIALETNSLSGNNGSIFCTSSSLTITKVISGSNRSIIKSGTGTLILSANNTYNGDTIIDNGNLNMPFSTSLGTGIITFNGGTLNYPNGLITDISSRLKNSLSAISINFGSNNIQFNSIIDSTNKGGFLKAGNGTLTLSSANTYTGGTYVSGGMIILTSPTSLGTNRNVTMENGTTLRANPLATLYYIRVTPSASITLDCLGTGGSSTTTAFGFDGIEGDSTCILNTLGNKIWFQGDTSRFFGNVIVNSGLFFGNSNGDLSNASLTLIGNKAILGNGSGSGPTNIRLGSVSGGAAAANIGGNWGGSLGAIITIGNRNIDSTFAGFIANAIGGTRFVKVGTGKFTVQGISTYTGSTTINGGIYEIGGTGRLGGVTGNHLGTFAIANGCIFSYNSTANQLLGGIISGQGSLIKNNTSVLTLSSVTSTPNSYTGFTAISAGTLTTHTLPSNFLGRINFASFTNSALTVNFASQPITGETYKLLSGSTINTYSSGNIILQNASGSATYNSTTSTLIIN